MDAFFEPDGPRFRATGFTRGPWSDDAQHGGPPCALLARAIEGDAGQGFVARVTFELLKPIPLSTFTVKTTLLRPGKRVRLFGASLLHGEDELLRATALVLAETPLELPPLPARPTLPPPESCPPYSFNFFRNPVGYHTAMELRVARGAWGEGAMAAWMRMRVALVAGESPSPLARVLVAADAGNGVSAALPVDRFVFINPDLTVHLHRRLEGEWVCLDAITRPEPNGIGLAQAELHDERGPIGRSLQSLLVTAR